MLGLNPVFVDVVPITFCMDVESLKKAITPKTKLIVPVHLYGHAAPMEEIMEIAEAHHLFVIEDNAQAIGCDYTFSNGVTKKTGTIGHIGATSFYPSKNLGAFGDGGALCTNDKTLAAKRDAAFLGFVDAIDTVQHGAFARAVGSNDGPDLMLAHVE